jgi:CRP-like cAMP-binding protein
MYLSANSALQAFVQRLQALAPLSGEDVDALLGLTAQVARVRANADIVGPGADFDHAILVSAGLVGRYLPLADGQRQITALHIAGDVADLHRVATPKAGTALQALTNAAIVKIPAKELKAIALTSPRITQAFWIYSAVDAAVLTRWAVNLGRREARVRMAHLLCEIALRMEAADQGTRTDFLLELTQAQLGDMLGLTPVHVNRTLKALKEAGAVEVEGRLYRIPDWPRLAAIAEFDDDYLQIVPAVEEAA